MRVLIFAAGLLLATPVLADDATQAKPDDPDKVVCKKQRPTGSHLPVRVCLTKAQWDDLSQASERALKSATARPSQGTPGGAALPTGQ